MGRVVVQADGSLIEANGDKQFVDAMVRRESLRRLRKQWATLAATEPVTIDGVEYKVEMIARYKGKFIPVLKALKEDKDNG